MLAPSKTFYIVGRERGRYLDLRPYSNTQYWGFGTLSNQGWSRIHAAGHITDFHAYGNVFNKGHFYTRYQIWRTNHSTMPYSRPPRLCWTYNINILQSAPTPAFLSWEMSKRAGVLTESSYKATVSEIQALLVLHETHRLPLRNDDLRKSIQARVEEIAKRNPSELSSFLINLLHRNGFDCGSIRPICQSLASSSLPGIVPLVSPKAQEMWAQRLKLIQEFRNWRKQLEIQGAK